MIHLLLRVVLRVTSYYWVGMTTLAAFIAVRQEAKIYAPKSLPSLSLWGCLKVFMFNILWMNLCGVGAVVSVVMHVTQRLMLQKNPASMAQLAHQVEEMVAKTCIYCFVGKVEIQGAEHLPTSSTRPAPIYVANHASQIDVGAVYALHDHGIPQAFQWIAKQSVLYLPGVGVIMWLGRHVLIQRSGTNKRASTAQLFAQSNTYLKSGIPMFLFPQGTRFQAKRLKFKDGAFIMAHDNAAELIPMSIHIPPDAWNSAYPITRRAPCVTITVHEAIESRDKSVEMLNRLCFDKIYSVLPQLDNDKDD